MNGSCIPHVNNTISFPRIPDIHAEQVSENTFCKFVLGVKDYTNWPTIPQVFIGGEFVGGCDIMLEMHKNGELIEELKKAGIRSALLDEPQKQV